MEFSDKVVLITGSSSGIGAGTAVEFAKKGARVCITGRNDSGLQTTKLKCLEFTSDDKVLVHKADLYEIPAMDELLAKVLTRFGRLDILVNNAGVSIPGTLESTSTDQFTQVLDIQLKSPFYLTKIAAPHLIKTRGCIVNVSSIGSAMPIKLFLANGVSKAALDMLTKYSALELAKEGVRVNSVNPGVINATEAIRSGKTMNEERIEKFKAHQLATLPLGRLGTVEEVAATILFLSSSAAANITGQMLISDGGRSIATWQ